MDLWSSTGDDTTANQFGGPKASEGETLLLSVCVTFLGLPLF